MSKTPKADKMISEMVGDGIATPPENSSNEMKANPTKWIPSSEFTNFRKSLSRELSSTTGLEWQTTEFDMQGCALRAMDAKRRPAIGTRFAVNGGKDKGFGIDMSIQIEYNPKVVSGDVLDKTVAELRKKGFTGKLVQTSNPTSDLTVKL